MDKYYKTTAKIMRKTMYYQMFDPTAKCAKCIPPTSNLIRVA